MGRGRPVKMTARIQQAITTFRDGKVGKIAKETFKVELAAFLKKTDKRITLRHLDLWLTKASNAWIMDPTKSAVPIQPTGKRLNGMTTRRQSEIVAGSRQVQAKRITIPDESSDSSTSSSSSDENCRCFETHLIQSGSSAEDVIIVMPSTVHQNGNVSVVEESDTSNAEVKGPTDCVEIDSEVQDSTDSVEFVCEVKGSMVNKTGVKNPTPSVANNAVANRAGVTDPTALVVNNVRIAIPTASIANNSGVTNPTASVRKYPGAKGSSAFILNNPDPNVRQRFLSGDEVHNFFKKIGLTPKNPLPTKKGSTQAGTSSQSGCNQAPPASSIGKSRQLSTTPTSLPTMSTATLPTMTLPLPPITPFFPMTTPSVALAPSPPPSFAEALQILANRAKTVVPVPPTILKSEACQTPEVENVEDNSGPSSNAKANNPAAEANKRIPEVLSSIQNILNVLRDSHRTMEAGGRRVRIPEIQVAQDLLRGYSRELLELTN